MKWFLTSFILIAAAAGLSRHLASEAASPIQMTRDVGAVVPVTAYQCPANHPIKGNFTAYSGERCIFQAPGEVSYDQTKPEKCYTSPADAIADGCGASHR